MILTEHKRWNYIKDFWDYKNNKDPNLSNFNYSEKVNLICENGHKLTRTVSSVLIANSILTCKQCKTLVNHPQWGNIREVWDYENNDSPEKLSFGEHQYVNLICKNGHQFKRKVVSLTRRVNKVFCEECNTLEFLFPNISKFWDCAKNKGLPNEVGHASEKKVWWKCQQGHSFSTPVYNMVRYGEFKCPLCIGRVVQDGVNDLASQKPLIASLYSKKNKNPADRVWMNTTLYFKWDYPCGHQIKTSPQVIEKYNGNCVYCSNDFYLEGFNGLDKTHPELKKEWSSKNKLPMSKYFHRSQKEVWWHCLDCGYDTKKKICHKLYRKDGEFNGCGVCSGQIIKPGFNDLSTKFPELIHLYDEKKNGISATKIFTSGPIWWKCELGHSFKNYAKNIIRADVKCSICGNRELLTGFNDLKTKEPEVAKYFNEDKNKISTSLVKVPTSNEKFWWFCKDCGREYKSDLSQVIKNKNQCCKAFCYYKGYKFRSNLEKEIFKVVETLLPEGEVLETGNRKIIEPYELDIFVPRLKVAIEVNGDHWHSDYIIKRNKGMSADEFHNMKVKLAAENGVRLLHIFEGEWNKNNFSAMTELKKFLFSM